MATKAEVNEQLSIDALRFYTLSRAEKIACLQALEKVLIEIRNEWQAAIEDDSIDPKWP